MAKQKSNENKSNGESTAIAIVGSGQVPGMGQVTPEILKAELASGDAAAQVVKLEPGQFIRGELLGKGGDLSYQEPDGDERALGTWLLEVEGGLKVKLITSHQLDKDLPEFVGRRVFITHLGQKDLGKRRVNVFQVVGH